MKLKKATASLLVLSFFATPLVNSPTAFANNPQLINYAPTANKVEYTNGSVYYPTSNIREWLNNNQQTVQYTNDPPTYKNEAGFLSEFTQTEYNAILVTKRRVHLHSHYSSASDNSGGDVSRYDGYEPTRFLQVASPNIQKAWRGYRYQDVNDKAFMLSLHEMYEYVLKRGWDMRRELTPAEMQRLNRSNPYYSYFTNSYNYSTSGNQMWAIDEVGRANYGGSAHSNNGIVPALHVKPLHVFSDGRLANSLKVGDTVKFGTYKGVPVEWDVINVTADGYPLLWSKKILTIKQFDQAGEKILRYSESVNFPTADVSINTDLQYKNHNGSTDITEPTLAVVNDADLKTRRNDKFTLILEAKDEAGGSGMDYVILPDGTKDSRSMVTYEVTQNGRYDFVAVDKAGNQLALQVPIGNISPPPSVLIKSSATGWTNNDVTVDISTSLDQFTDWNVPSFTSNGAKDSPSFSNYSSYSGKKYRVTGQVRLVSNKGGVSPINSSAIVRMPYRVLVGTESFYYTSYRWDVPVSIPMNTLINANGSYVSFDKQYTIAGAYFDSLNAWLGILTANEDVGKYTVEWKDVKVELLDKEELYIDTITLPNGTQIKQNNYSQVLTTPGDYLYKVLDSRGKLTEKVITVKIDKVLPTATHTLNPNTFTNKDLKITVKGADNASGVKRILKPNGEWATGDTVDYYVPSNGTYEFTIEDHAGNTLVYPVVVNKIDKQNPQIKFIETSRDWAAEDLAVPIEITDVGVSGPKEYRYAWSTTQIKPTTGWSGWYAGKQGIITHNKEGMFYLHIEAVDNAGNTVYANSGVYRKLDNANLSMALNVYPLPSDWNNKAITVSVTESMNYAGDPYIEKKYEINNQPNFPKSFTKTLPSDNKLLLGQQGFNYVHIQYTLGTGTRIKQTFGPYLIDTAKIGPYVAQVTNASGVAVNGWSKNSIYLSIKNPSTASVSGYIRQYRIENYDYDWKEYVDGMEILAEGENRVFTRVINNAGTVGEQKILTAKLDKEISQFSDLKLKLEADGKYNVSVLVNDKTSGIKEVRLNTANGVRAAKSTNKLFSFNQIDSKPISINIVDNADNVTANIPFADIPIINFTLPYQLNGITYRGNVEATITNGTIVRYQIGNKMADCLSVPCKFTIDRNTTINAINIDGSKQSERAIKITNIDNGKINLILSGTRGTTDKKITVTWNHALTGGTLSCYEGGKLKTFNVSNKSHSFVGINTSYDCQVKGKIGTEVIESNRAVIYADEASPIEGDSGLKKLKSDIYMEESRIGTSYFINPKSTNQKDANIMLPIELFK